MKLHKQQPYKATVIHALQQRDPATRVNFYKWFLQSVRKDEADHSTFILMKRGSIYTKMFRANDRHCFNYIYSVHFLGLYVKALIVTLMPLHSVCFNTFLSVQSS
jgi:hypothetical protein